MNKFKKYIPLEEAEIGEDYTLHHTYPGVNNPMKIKVFQTKRSFVVSAADEKPFVIIKKRKEKEIKLMRLYKKDYGILWSLRYTLK